MALGLASPAAAQIVDPVFNPGASDKVFAIAVQADGKVVVGGDFVAIGGGGTGSTPRLRIARLNPDGTVDAAFNPGAASTSGTATVFAIAVQPDGKILVAGVFTSLGGGTGTTHQRRCIGRLLADGSVDSGFNPNAGTMCAIYALAIQPDGKILIGGGFSGLGASSRLNIGRLNVDGTVDAFNPGVGGFGLVTSIVVQPDTKILVAGGFSGLGGGNGTAAARQSIGRLNADGTVDAFNPGIDAAGIVRALSLQADGGVIVAGGFVGLGGGTGTTPRANIGRVAADGTIDLTFDVGANGVVSSLALQADGRLTFAGGFTLAGGGGTGSSTRNRIARVSPAGVLDTDFDPGASHLVFALAQQSNGDVLVGGDFTGLGGGTGTTTRNGLGRLQNRGAIVDRLHVAGGSTITWTRGGLLPEITSAAFASSPDGTTYTPLGTATRALGASSWELTGVSLTLGPNLRIKATGTYGSGYFNSSGSITTSVAPVSGNNIIENGSFDALTASWSTFALPDATGMQSNVTAGVFQFSRTGTQAVVLQSTGLPLPSGSPVLATFSLGNTDTARKRISVLIHDSNFADSAVCTFWLEANAPLRVYGMRAHSSQAWANATISFYAASIGSGGFYQVDNVSLTYEPTNATNETVCVDPDAPPPPGGATGPTLITNGQFGSGLPPWSVFGQMSWQLTSGVFEFVKNAGTPAGVVLQSTNTAASALQLVTATFKLGNSSGVRKRVTVLVGDVDFSDLSACTFWLAPGQPLGTYTYRTYATRPWANATVSFYPSTAGPEQWIQLDDVTLQHTPSALISGTTCLEP